MWGWREFDRQGCLSLLKYPLRKSERPYSVKRSKHIYMEIHIIVIHLRH